MITVYSKRSCAPCLLLKGLLNQRNIYFEERDVSDPAIMEELVSRYSVFSVPVTVIDDQPIIGPNISEILKRLTPVV